MVWPSKKILSQNFFLAFMLALHSRVVLLVEFYILIGKLTMLASDFLIKYAS